MDKGGLTGGEVEHYLSELSATYGKQKNIEEAVAEVEESHTVTLPTEHSYVRIYGAMCAVIREDGDMLSDGYSVFQRNLQYLKEEIRENLLLCKSKMHGFTGLDVLSVLPVCFLPVVRLWAIRVSEGLSAYYYGSYGMLTTVLLFAATIGIYGLILWLFLPDEEQKDRVPAGKVAVTVSVDGIFTGCLCQPALYKMSEEK